MLYRFLIMGEKSIDLAMPRDIDPAVHKLDGVYLYDLDSLQSMAHEVSYFDEISRRR
jgi:glutamyl-tRNA reductase